MERYKLPGTKRDLKFIIDALALYKTNGITKLTSDESASLMSKLWGNLSPKDNKEDVKKVNEATVVFAQEAYRLMLFKFEESEVDLDILIAKYRIMLKRVEGKSDAYLVEDLIGELPKA